MASLWEVAGKFALRKPGLDLDPRELRAGLVANGYLETVVEARHALAIAGLPAIHGDPFDRLLLAQAQVEALTLLTADRRLAAYGGPVRLA